MQILSNSIIHAKTFDNGMICAFEQSVIVLESIYDAVKAEFAARGCYFLDPMETEKVRKTIIINGAPLVRRRQRLLSSQKWMPIVAASQSVVGVMLDISQQSNVGQDIPKNWI